MAQLYGFSKEPNPQAGRIYDAEGISPTLDTCSGGNRMPKIAEPIIVASRGRNPDNPSDRSKGCPTVQRLEPNTQGTANTLTTVQKDNLLAEPIVYDDYNGRVRPDQTTIGTITPCAGNTAPKNNYKIIEPQTEAVKGSVIINGRRCRIRKLTEKECIRLMGFSDDDYFKMAVVNVKTRIYEEAGNSIVVNVMMAIFQQFF